MRLLLALILSLFTVTPALALDDATASDMRAELVPQRAPNAAARVPSLDQWQSMTPADREAWKKDHPEAAAAFQEKKDRYDKLSPKQQVEARKNWQSEHPAQVKKWDEKSNEWRNATPQERQAMKQKWQDSKPQGN